MQALHNSRLSRDLERRCGGDRGRDRSYPLARRRCLACALAVSVRRATARRPKDLIGRMITYRIQEEAFGGLDQKALKLMDRARGGNAGSETIRRLRAGTVLVREHGGARHTVTVVAGGFAWNDAIYPSLSSVARAITGTAWNGPRFFGLTTANMREKSEPQQGPTERAPPVRVRICSPVDR